jgi:ACS family glucarate transporter-like MFS transporter
VIGIRWIVLVILIAGSSISYILRFNVSIVGDSMMLDLGMNEYQLGIIFSAFAAGYTLFQLPGGMVGDRFGPRYTITGIAIAWTILTVITAVVPPAGVWSVSAIVAALVVTRVFVGITNGPFFPVAYGGTMATWFPVRQWGTANGLGVAGMTLGAAATGPMLVWLMESYGWRGALLITAPCGLLLAALYYWFSTDNPADHPRIRPAELELIRSDRPPGENSTEKGAWLKALRNRNILLLSLSYFCMNYVFYLFFSWFYYYLINVKQFAPADAAVFVAAQWVLGAIGGIAGGFGCDLLVRRLGLRHGPRLLAMTSLILSGVFLYMGAMSDNITVVVVTLCASFGFTQISDSPFWVATLGVSGRHGAVATGVLNTGGNIPGIVGGLMVPFLANWLGWPAAIASGSVFAITGGALWFFVRADEPMVSLDPADSYSPSAAS